MKPTKFVRKGHQILQGKKVVFEGKRKVGKTEDACINAAKRESRRIQIAEDGGLGRGTVKVVS